MKTSIIVHIFILLATVLFPFCCPAEAQNGLKYEKTNDSIVITGCEDGVNDVVIPEEIDGLPVQRIADYAFRGRQNLKTVVLPGSLQKAKGLEYDELDDTYVEAMLPGLGYWAFKSCVSLETVTFSPGTKSLEPFLFEGFEDCNRLKEFRVPENNPNYSSVDGVLFSRDGKTLLIYPAKRRCPTFTYTVPDGVTEIRPGAFYDSPLPSIVLPKGLTKISAFAFYECTRLKTLTIQNGDAEIDCWAFLSCPLENITVPKGSEAEKRMEEIRRIGGYGPRTKGFPN